MTRNDKPAYDALRPLKEQLSKRHLGRDGVTGVGMGRTRDRDGRPGPLAVRFYVENRQHPSVATLPAEVGGWPTEIIQADFRFPEAPARTARRSSALADTARYNPVTGGISIGPASPAGNGLAGTLGLIVADASGAPMILTNRHVVGATGDAVCQPASIDYGGRCANCAVVTQLLLGNYRFQGVWIGIDAAVARFSSWLRASSRGTIVGIGAVAGQAAAVEGAPIRKRGRSTGLTQSTVYEVNADVIGANNVELMNQILILPQNPPFSAGGDSGSVCVQGNQAVGLLWGHSKNGMGAASPIGAVLEAFRVQL
jgi:hypothetical protein